jgi:prophage tail gpP-like protein
MATGLNITVSKRLLASARDFPLTPFQECTVSIGSDRVLTGYIGQLSAQG